MSEEDNNEELSEEEEKPKQSRAKRAKKAAMSDDEDDEDMPAKKGKKQRKKKDKNAPKVCVDILSISCGYLVFCWLCRTLPFCYYVYIFESGCHIQTLVSYLLLFLLWSRFGVAELCVKSGRQI
jgi:hypothetical protein